MQFVCWGYIRELLGRKAFHVFIHRQVQFRRLITCAGLNFDGDSEACFVLLRQGRVERLHLKELKFLYQQRMRRNGIIEK